MALKPTIHKATLSITNIDKNYYNDHSLTIAKHPSETDARMMVRVLAFALHADESLQFTKGLSTDDEPDIWLKNQSGEIVHWIELGQPDEKRLRKACGRSQNVWIYCYSGNSADIWWQQNKGKFNRFSNLSVINIPADTVTALSAVSDKSMKIQFTIQDGTTWITSENEQSLEITPQSWRSHES